MRLSVDTAHPHTPLLSDILENVALKPFFRKEPPIDGSVSLP